MIIHMLQKSDLKEELPPCIHLSVAYTISFFFPLLYLQQVGEGHLNPNSPCNAIEPQNSWQRCYLCQLI